MLSSRLGSEAVQGDFLLHSCIFHLMLLLSKKKIVFLNLFVFPHNFGAHAMLLQCLWPTETPRSFPSPITQEKQSHTYF